MTLLDLRALRKHRGLSQASLAKAIGLSQKRVSAMELRPGSITAAQLERVLEALGFAFHLKALEEWVPSRGLGDGSGSAVYVLPHKVLPVLKIGKANDVLLRADLLEGADVLRGRQLLVDSEAAAYNLESVLHRAFRPWRLTAYEAARLGVGASGATEWFRADCTEKVMSFLAANGAILGFAIAPVAPDPAADPESKVLLGIFD
ncbi:helix-turn-helix domain-containing protein [Ramlibacter sp. XY19]|uniref:helix-turn-helix domain-containing protein n=1 Tax=Ramlibacter paludis TaxID=2908000 RepID=UPI0023DCC4ED|nr:helix-turn-helix transcriptional regulator [Ramlibacter paludis]MCG2593455.1 helix-turn-helix domain-containing protein [Ramlibacter paludis]